MDDLELRRRIYEHIVETGEVPSRALMATWPTDADGLDDQLERLHERHLIVLDRRPDRAGEIRMALPFSAEPTDHRVTTAAGSWWANCAWDSLAVVAALGTDGHVSSVWSDTDQPLDLEVRDGDVDGPDGFVQFLVPASRWWDDVVET